MPGAIVVKGDGGDSGEDGSSGSSDNVCGGGGGNDIVWGKLWL